MNEATLDARAKTGPMISDAKKVKCMEFVKCCTALKDPFEDVTWNIRSIGLYVEMKKPFKPVEKHPPMVHV